MIFNKTGHQADWHWHANRDVNNPRAIWHNPRGQRIEVILFGYCRVLQISR